jgi:hypothetical protein
MNWIYLKRTWAIVGALAFLLGLGGTVVTIDSRYAHSEDVKAVVQTLQKLNDRIDQQTILEVQRRIFELENEYRDKPMPQYVSDEIVFLKAHIKRLEVK